MKQVPDYRQLLQKLANNQCSETEFEQLMKFLGDPEHEGAARELLTEIWSAEQENKELALTETQQHSFEAHLQQLLRPRHRKTWSWVAAAAILVAGVSLWLGVGKNRADRTTQITEPILPAVNKQATLTLSDGRKILLNAGKKAIQVKAGGVSYIDGSSILSVKASSLAGISQTISTGNGGLYALTLPDGTRAWLNAASSLTFPSAFGAGERHVKMTGEVYFEIAQDVNKPFNVEVNDKTSIHVLGTSFNVKAYRDQKLIGTTLLNGSIALENSTHRQLLHPGQLALLDRQTDEIGLKDGIDVNQTLAWKNGLFNFKGSTLPEIMAEVARWYDVHVLFETPVEGTFVARIPRSVPLQELLKLLELTQKVSFNIEGKTIKVMKAK